jgi:hypothetical protein
MKFLAPVIALMVLIFGLVQGPDVFDKQCADHFGAVGKPWAICGQDHYQDDPNNGKLIWSGEPHVFFFPFSLPHLCKSPALSFLNTLLSLFWTVNSPASIQVQTPRRNPVLLPSRDTHASPSVYLINHPSGLAAKYTIADFIISKFCRMLRSTNLLKWIALTCCTPVTN